MPQREVFTRDQREPSASIVIKTRGGRLDPQQVRAIQNLVAAAVPGLKPGRVAIVDDRGNLLASPQEELNPAAAAANRIDRSEEHTSELQSLMRISYAVFCLQKKKLKTQHNNTY